MELGRVREHVPRRITEGGREAAVLVPVCERDGAAHLLFTKRADHLGEHPGQMSFPGGGREPGDADLTETALREAKEEIGLEPEEVEMVGRLDDIQTVTGYTVSPFVGRIPDRTYEPDEREVAEVVVLPLSGLLDPANHNAERRDHPELGSVVVDFFDGDGYTVWGATGRILVQFLGLVDDWERPAAVPAADADDA